MFGKVLATDFFGGDDQYRVIACDGSQHAIEARSVESRGYDVRRSRWCFHHDEVVGVVHFGHPVAQNSAQMIRGRYLFVRVFWQRIDQVAAGNAYLDRSDVLEITRHRGLGCLDPGCLEEFDELTLRGHCDVGEQLDDLVLPGRLAHDISPNANAR